MDSYILRVKLMLVYPLVIASYPFALDGRTRKSVSPGRGLPFGRGPRSGSGSGSSGSGSPESSMSVVSVPFDDGAIGDGSRISLGLDASGDD